MDRLDSKSLDRWIESIPDDDDKQPDPTVDDGEWYGWNEEEHNQAFGIDEQPYNEETGEWAPLFECANCGYLFYSSELNTSRICRGCADYLNEEW